MTITNRTIISFHVPDEYPMAMKFESENDMNEWSKQETSGWIFYRQEKTIFAKDGDSDDE